MVGAIKGMQKITTRRLIEIQRPEVAGSRYEPPKNEYLCANCGARATSYHQAISVSRVVDNRMVEVRGEGLGTWRCTRENRKVAVRRVPMS